MSDVLDLLKSALADRYTIERELGSGGMATVYLAHDLKHDREVAVKVLRPELSAELGAERFLREIRIAAKLNHPHILALYDSDEADGFLYYVMPYVAGESLRGKLDREKQLAMDEAIALTQQVAAALDYAHQEGVIHRDIKPENILLHEGEAMVADFGIALAVSAAGGQRLTETGLSLGTPAYMSPEQVSGDEELDGRSDIYSLACVLYEMLAGDPPFVASTARAVMARHLTDAAPPLGTVRSDAPATVAHALSKALSKAPADRYGSAAEFYTGLTEEGSDAERTQPSIAVLPFTNMSPAPDTEYFAVGITEEIINALANVSGLRVIARTSAFALKDMNLDVREVGRMLDVEKILEGSVRTAGSHLRVTAQLIDGRDGAHVWSERYDRNLDDVFAIQSDIATRVAEAIEVRLLPHEKTRLGKPAAQNLDAYNLYLLGLHHRERWTPEGMCKGIEYLERALAIDPEYPQAYAAIGYAYFQRGTSHGDLLPTVAGPKARQAVARALEIDERTAEAHAVSGLIKTVFEWDWQGAERAFVRAIELSPGNALAHDGYGYYLNVVGRHEEALREAALAVRLDPLSWIKQFDYAWYLYCARRNHAAVEQVGKALEIDPSKYLSNILLAWCYLALGMRDAAERELDTLGSVDVQHATHLSYLAHINAQVGRVAESRLILQTLKRRSYDPRYAEPFALTYLALGKVEDAFEWLERSYQERLQLMNCLNSPLFDAIRAEERFRDLLARTGLTDR